VVRAGGPDTEPDGQDGKASMPATTIVRTATWRGAVQGEGLEWLPVIEQDPVFRFPNEAKEHYDEAMAKAM